MKKGGNIIKLSKQELLNVTGGDGFGLATFIGGALTFIIGIIEGYLNPSKCN